MVGRNATPELVRGVYQGAMKVFLDRFLNVPAARLPGARRLAPERPDLAQLHACWDQEGHGRRGRGHRLRLASVGRRRPPCWPPSALRCWPRTPSSTGSRPTRRRSAKPTPGRRDRSRPRSSWPGRPASSPPTPHTPGTGPGGAHRRPPTAGRGALRGDLTVNRQAAPVQAGLG